MRPSRSACPSTDEVHRRTRCPASWPGSAGAFLADFAGIYREGQTGGRGFIGLAAMIFGNWRPGGLVAGAGLFGYTDAVQLRQGATSRARAAAARGNAAGRRRRVPAVAAPPGRRHRHDCGRRRWSSSGTPSPTTCRSSSCRRRRTSSRCSSWPWRRNGCECPRPTAYRGARARGRDRCDHAAADLAGRGRRSVSALRRGSSARAGAMARRTRHVADVHPSRRRRRAARPHARADLDAALARRAHAVVRADPRALTAGERAAAAHPAAPADRGRLRARATSSDCARG